MVPSRQQAGADSQGIGSAGAAAPELKSKHAKDKAKQEKAQEAAPIVLPLLEISLEHRLLGASLLRDLLA